MRLRREPKDIPEAIFQSTLVHLESVTGTDAVVRVGGKHFPFRRIHFRVEGELYWDNVAMVSFTGPFISSFLFKEAMILAFINIKYLREHEK